MERLKIVINQEVLDRYSKVYFKEHPRAYKDPIERPTHPSINKWMIMKRPSMNALKQKWKSFIVWYVDDLGLTDYGIEKCSMIYKSVFKQKRRHDVDNIVPKFICDGMVEAGLVVDDDCKHIESLTLQCGYDDEERTEITINIEEKKEHK